MRWPSFLRPATPSASEAARVLAGRAAAARSASEITRAERCLRVAAELRRSGAVSPLPPREVVVAPIRAARARRKETANA